MLLDLSLEDASHERYSISARHWLRFLSDMKRWSYRINEDLLIEYAVWRYTFSKVIGKTVDTEISGIISYLNMYSRACLNRRVMYRLLCLMRGFKKLRPSKNSKAALTDSILKDLVKDLDDNNLDDAVLKTALIFKKGLILRNSEGWKWEFEGDGLLLKNVRFKSDGKNIIGLVVTFKKSKMNKFGKEEYASAPCVCKHGKLCPVHALWNLIDLRVKLGEKESPDMKIFEKTNGKVLSYDDIGKDIKKLCKVAGLEPALYAPHSLRKGGATDYIAWGVPIIIVKDMGRWAAIESMEPYRQIDANAMIALTSKKINCMLSYN